MSNTNPHVVNNENNFIHRLNLEFINNVSNISEVSIVSRTSNLFNKDNITSSTSTVPYNNGLTITKNDYDRFSSWFEFKAFAGEYTLSYNIAAADVQVFGLQFRYVDNDTYQKASSGVSGDQIIQSIDFTKEVKEVRVYIHTSQPDGCLTIDDIMIQSGSPSEVATDDFIKHQSTTHTINFKNSSNSPLLLVDGDKIVYDKNLFKHKLIRQDDTIIQLAYNTAEQLKIPHSDSESTIFSSPNDILIGSTKININNFKKSDIYFMNKKLIELQQKTNELKKGKSFLKYLNLKDVKECVFYKCDKNSEELMLVETRETESHISDIIENGFLNKEKILNIYTFSPKQIDAANNKKIITKTFDNIKNNQIIHLWDHWNTYDGPYPFSEGWSARSLLSKTTKVINGISTVYFDVLPQSTGGYYVPTATDGDKFMTFQPRIPAFSPPQIEPLGFDNDIVFNLVCKWEEKEDIVPNTSYSFSSEKIIKVLFTKLTSGSQENVWVDYEIAGSVITITDSSINNENINMQVLLEGENE